jgi:ABC-type phosphate transport system substrate-binding protein
LILALSMTALAMVVSAHAADPARSGYQLICNPRNPVTVVDRRFLQEAFLKKVRVWSTGDTAHPVDLAPSSPVRRRFTEEMLGRPVEAVRSFWQQRIFAGRDLPPPEVGSDEEVIRFVLRDRGAIGYVSGTASLAGAKALIVK